MHDIDEAASCGQHYFKIFMLGYVALWRCVMYLTDNLLSGYFRDVACPAVTSTRGGAP